MKTRNRIDTFYLLSVILLAVGGFIVFSSASLGLLARNGATFQSVALFQFIGLITGVCAFYVMSRIPYKFWRKFSFYIFVIALILNVLVFVPGLSLEHGGAIRWIDLKLFTFQPSEFLKLSFIIYFAAWLSGLKDRIQSFTFGVLPFLAISAVVGAILIAQSDTDTLAVILATGLGMLIVAGARWRDIGTIIILAIIGIGLIAMVRPYARARIMAYLNPGTDSLGVGYQVEQSLIAIGSGGINGRGFGQSIQKFNYLPEPIGDSIFAVAAEEFGLIGGVFLICLYIFFGFRTFRISARAPDLFSGLTVLGIAILIIVESFMNIGAMLGLIPLSGQPLIFVSHGGTSLVIMLGAAGIVANISRHQHN